MDLKWMDTDAIEDHFGSQELTLDKQNLALDRLVQ